jgi:hypothetical protein
LSQPEENAIEREARLTAPPDELEPDEEALPEPEYSPVSGLLLVPGFRFNGSDQNPPWVWPEESIFNWLVQSKIEAIEDRVLNGHNGMFWGRITRPDGDIQSVIVKFAGIGNDAILKNYGTEFQLQTGADLLAREMAAYEAVKVLGGEDIGFPICLKDLNSVELLSDFAREKLASILKIPPNQVDQELGVAGRVQLVARDSADFAEQWSTLGVTNVDRWKATSDELRYSLYRGYIIDFILGTPNRSAFGLVYNKNTNKLMMPDLAVSFPHSGFSAEKYMQMRAKGWGRSVGGAARFVDNTPPSANDFARTFDDLPQDYLEECILTAQQIVARMNDEMIGRLVLCLLEYQIPVESVASMVLRIAYVGMSVGSVIRRPIEFIRNVCVPLRAGGTIDDKSQEIVGYVDEMMTSIMEEPFSIAEVLDQPLPEFTELLI